MSLQDECLSDDASDHACRGLCEPVLRPQMFVFRHLSISPGKLYLEKQNASNHHEARPIERTKIYPNCRPCGIEVVVGGDDDDWGLSP